MGRVTSRRWVRGVFKAVFAAADLLLPRLKGPRILLYHQIEAGLEREMEVSKKTFAAQVKWLQQHGRVVDLEAALTGRDDPKADDMFVLTFDDGYADLFRHGFPVLRDEGLPFTLYLTTHPVESRIPLDSKGKAEPLTWDQLGEMMGSGLMTLGAHTHTHADLRNVDDDRVTEELDRCNALIGQRMGIQANHFAYPWGYWSAHAESLVAERYQTAAVASVFSFTPETHPLRLPRIPIQLSDGMVFFRRKAVTGLQAEDWMRRRVRGYQGPHSEHAPRRFVRE